MKTKQIQLKQRETLALKNIKSYRQKPFNWIETVLLISLTIIYWINGHALYPETVVLAARIIWPRIVLAAMYCWQYRVIIIEIILELSVIVVRVLEHT